MRTDQQKSRAGCSDAAEGFDADVRDETGECILRDQYGFGNGLAFGTFHDKTMRGFKWPL